MEAAATSSARLADILPLIAELWTPPRRAQESHRAEHADVHRRGRLRRQVDDAWVGSIDIAIKKAKTDCFFGMATGELGKLSQPGKPL
jgi:hypothetical protein